MSVSLLQNEKAFRQMLTTVCVRFDSGTEFKKGSVLIGKMGVDAARMLLLTLRTQAATSYLFSSSNRDSSHSRTSIIALNCEALMCWVFASILLKLKVLRSTPFKLTSRIRSVVLSPRFRCSFLILEPICIDSSFLILQSGISSCILCLQHLIAQTSKLLFLLKL